LASGLLDVAPPKAGKVCNALYAGNAAMVNCGHSQQGEGNLCLPLIAGERRVSLALCAICTLAE
ncbi:MAG: hypothetical protein EBZ48_15365, partial [Proteobacteria bacterium]|nr:hypothetical protein [Pseudomonadota bacterium]